jgi:hypothetical protein
MLSFVHRLALSILMVKQLHSETLLLPSGVHPMLFADSCSLRWIANVLRLQRIVRFAAQRRTARR